MKKEAFHIRSDQIRLNAEKTRDLHQQKTDRSSPFFSQTKVTSCSRVLIRGGQAVCVGFGGSRAARSSTVLTERQSYAS